MNKVLIIAGKLFPDFLITYHEQCEGREGAYLIVC